MSSLSARLALASLPLVAMVAQAQTAGTPRAASAVVRSYDIPAGPLGAAINRFVAESGAFVAADGALTQGKTSGTVRGSFSLSDALKKLLDGTGLDAVPQPNGSYALRRATSAPLPAAVAPPVQQPAEAVLPAVVVRGSSEGLPGEPPKAYAGGQVARGGRVGILGDKDVFETPFNVTNFTAQAIADQQATKVGDVVKADPSVRVANATASYSEEFLIRGFRVNQHSISFDGLSGTVPNYGAGSLQAIERVEVFKGANTLLGGLTGGLAVGGNINLVPKRAADQALTQLTTSFASDSLLSSHLDVGRRFGADNQFGVRVNAFAQSGNTAFDDAKEKRHLLALAFDYRGDKARMFVDLGEQLQNTRGAPSSLFADVGIAIPRPPRSGSNFTQPWSYSDIKVRYGVVRAEFDITPDVTVYAAHGGHDNRYHQLLPFGILLAGGRQGDLDETFQNGNGRDMERTTEAGLRAKFSTGPVQHQLVLSAKRTRFESHALYVFDEADGGAPTVPSNLYNPVRVAAPTSLFFRDDLPRENILEFPTLALADTLSAYGDRLQLTVGLRRQRIDTKRFDSGDSGPNATGALLRSYDDSALTPAVAALFKLTPALALYGNYIESLQAGPTAPDTAVNRGEIFPPSKTRQYEVGVKVNLGEFALTTDLFDITQPIGITDPTTRIFSAAGTQRNRGVELNVFGQLSKSLRLNGGLMYLDAKLTKTEGGLLDGKQVVGVPKTNLTLLGEWDTPFVSGLTLTAGVLRTGSTFVDTGNAQPIPAFTVFDLGLRYKTQVAERPLTLRAGVTNVLNKSYFIADPFGSFYQSAPRTFQLSATVDF